MALGARTLREKRRKIKHYPSEFFTQHLTITQRKSRKVESVIKASITNKRTNVILITKRNIYNEDETHPTNSTEHHPLANIWEGVSCAQTCLRKIMKRVFCFTLPECFSCAMLRIFWGRPPTKNGRRKNDELQKYSNISNISLSRSLHIIVHNHW